MDRDADGRSWDMVRRAVQRPETEAYLAADRLQEDVRRLQARLAQVRSRGGRYRRVDLSDGVRGLLARLEAGATLSTYVH